MLQQCLAMHQLVLTVSYLTNCTKTTIYKFIIFTDYSFSAINATTLSVKHKQNTTCRLQRLSCDPVSVSHDQCRIACFLFSALVMRN